MVLALEKKMKNNSRLSHSEKTIMELLENQLNRSKLDKTVLNRL